MAQKNERLIKIMDNIDPKKVDVELIKKAIQHGQKFIKRTQNCKHSVIFWGFTGTGKSSTIVALSGKKLYGYFQGFPKLTTPDNLKQNGRVFIQEAGDSGTAYPAKLKMKTGLNEDQIMLWDSAGLADTKGITQILINTYFIYRIFNIQQQLKMIFTFNARDLSGDDRGKGFSATVKTLTVVLEKFQNYHECMGILITKVPHEAEESDFYSQIEERIKEYRGQKTDKVEKFFDLLLKKKLKLIFIRQPKVGKKDKKQSPKDVTDEYIDFRNQFKQLVLSLKSAKSPKLNALGLMQDSQIEKCNQLEIQTKKKLAQQRKKLYQDLQKFILDKLVNITFTENMQNNKKHLQTIKNVRQLKQKMIIYCKQKNAKPKQIFDNLTALFEHPDYEFKCEQQLTSQKAKIKFCAPMRKYKNDLIIIDFLSTIKADDKEIGLDLEIKNLVDLLKSKSDSLWTLMRLEIDTILQKFKSFLEKKFDNHFKKWMQQEVSKVWTRNFKILPSMVMKAKKYMTSKTIQAYLKEIRELEAVGNMSCTTDFIEIQDLLKYNKITANLTLFENKFIEENIGKIIRDVQNQMNAFLLTYQSQSKESIHENLKFYSNQRRQRPGISGINDLTAKEVNLMEKEEQLRTKDEELKKKEKDLKEKEEELRKKQEDIHKREQEMQLYPPLNPYLKKKFKDQSKSRMTDASQSPFSLGTNSQMVGGKQPKETKEPNPRTCCCSIQ